MRVRDVMKGQPRFCDPEQGLAAAGRIMVEVGCGVLPVVAKDGRVVGMITDRDICSMVSIKDQRPSEIRVADAMSDPVYSCRAEDEIDSALGSMQEHRVRRLPVLDGDGHLVGLLALDDIALEVKVVAAELAGASLHRSIAETLKKISEHPVLAVSKPRGAAEA